MFPWLIERMLVDIRRLSTAATASSSVMTTTTSTWDFSGGDVDLNVTVDGVPQVITIHVAGFVAPALATADEVAAEIILGIAGGTAYVTEENAVVIASSTVGAGGDIQVTGGAANAILLFPTGLVEDGAYDPIFGGTRQVATGVQQGQDARRYYPLDTMDCQVDRNNFGDQEINAGGVQTTADLVLTLDRQNLLAAGLIRADGTPRFNPGDRLVRIRSQAGVIQEEFGQPPGMYVRRIERAGFGLSMMNPEFNLVYLHCNRPDQGP